MEAKVTANSQSYRLRQRAEDARIQHGQEVRADVPRVRVVSRPLPTGGVFLRMLGIAREVDVERVDEVYFCDMGPLVVREELIAGDGGPVPESVAVEGLSVPTPGYYDLQNVLVRSNGDLRLVVDERTRITPSAWPTEFTPAF